MILIDWGAVNIAGHPSPEGGTTLTKDHPAIPWIYDGGIWDSPILLGCFGEKIVFVSICRHWLAHFLLRYDDFFLSIFITV